MSICLTERCSGSTHHSQHNELTMVCFCNYHFLRYLCEYCDALYRIFCIKPVVKRKKMCYDMKLLNSGAVS